MAIVLLDTYSPEIAARIREIEDDSDRYEDILGSYLVKLSSKRISEADSNDAAMLLKLIGDMERISDHAVGIVAAAEEMREKKLSFSPAAMHELKVLCNAVTEISRLAVEAFINNDITAARRVEPLDQLIDSLKEDLRSRHIIRLQQGDCSIEAGFVWSDLLTDINRVAGHCSNIAGCVLDITHQKMNLHESLRAWRTNSEEFREEYEAYSKRFSLNN